MLAKGVNKKSRTRATVVIASHLLLLFQPAIAADTVPVAATESQLVSLADTGAVRLASGVHLTAEAQAMSEQLHLYQLIGQISILKEQLQSHAEILRTTDGIAIRQDLCEARQEMTRRILKANLEVDYVLAAIEGEQNQNSALSRSLAVSRDNAILMNTVLAQLTNGVFWSLSGIFTMVSIDHAQAGNPDGISSIIAGAVPSVLALYALYQANGPKRRLPKHPNMLAPLFTNASTEDGYYPDTVLTFLNSAPGGAADKRTRKQLLIEQWIKAKYIGNSKGILADDKKAALVSGTTEKKRALTLSLLSTRQAMLADVRSIVCQMKQGLMELMPVLE